MNHAEKSWSALGVAAGFLGGALVGAAVALLLAPCSGNEARRKLRERAERSKHTLERIRTGARAATSAARTAFAMALDDESAPR